MTPDQFGRRDLFKKAAAMGALGTALGVPKMVLAQDESEPVREKVPTKKLGSTGKDVPILLMGCSQAFDMTYDRILHRGFAEGITYLDTAQAYANGKNHEQLAPFIQQVGRENLWITSKVMLFGDKATPEDYVSNLEGEMPKLKVDKLDMFFMHSLRDLFQLGPDYIKMGQDLKKRGLIDYFGFSCHLGTVVELMNKAAEIGTEGIDVIQFRYNFTQYGDVALNKAIDACKKAGIGLIAMKTQASVPADQDEVKRFQSENFTLHQAKLKAVWADERIDTVVSEMTNTQMIRENAAAAKSSVQLTMHEFQQLRQYAIRTAHFRCNGCSQHCESKTAGQTRIADTLRFLMYDDSYDKRDLARTRYREMTDAERAIDGIDFTAAVKACPQGIDIPERLREARARLA